MGNPDEYSIQPSSTSRKILNNEEVKVSSFGKGNNEEVKVQQNLPVNKRSKFFSKIECMVDRMKDKIIDEESFRTDDSPFKERAQVIPEFPKNDNIESNKDGFVVV